MARKGWFDEEPNELEFSKYVQQMESWQKALADGVVTLEEVNQQAERVTNLLRALEPKLSDELHEELTTIFRELAVLYGMQSLVGMTLEEKGG